MAKDRTAADETDSKDHGIATQVNDSIYALASHLCTYVDILRQFSVRPGGR